jgi:hypothetical protein
MRSAKSLLIMLFSPSGSVFFDIVLPAAVMAIGSLLLAKIGVIGKNIALGGFVFGALIYVALSGSASCLKRGEQCDKYHGKFEKDNR